MVSELRLGWRFRFDRTSRVGVCVDYGAADGRFRVNQLLILPYMRSALLAFLVALFGAASLQAQSSDIFTYESHVRLLDNDLQVIVIPTDYPNIAALYIPVAVGSRNEVEPGKSGFAHFFEHMMFRGTENVSAEQYQQILQRAGADQNAYTTDDRTVYHITISKEDLEEVIALEADRFQNLSYSEAAFRTEALAVLGEYNKNNADPIQKLLESQRALAFADHTYRHTTMGFLEDIMVMPDQLEYSHIFFDRFYRPEYTSIVVVGDVDAEEVFDMVERYWGDWERGSYVADIPVEPAPDGPLYGHVAWDSPTLPWVSVGFRTPAAYGDDDMDIRALDVMGTYAFGPASDLFRRLVIEEQVVDGLFVYAPDRVDPYLTTVFARVNNVDDVAYVRDAIQETIADVRVNGIDPDRLEAIKSNLRYGFAQGLDNSPAIAGAVASFVANTRDIETINHVYAAYEALTANYIREVANTYLTDERMVVVTLSHEELDEAAAGYGSVDGRLENHVQVVPGPEVDTEPVAIESSHDEYAFETLILESSSPLIDIRFQFNSGAANDPEGKEGLAMLTASMISDAGSRMMTYSEIQQALFPMASGFWSQVDKDMTTFGGRAHIDNLEAYYEIIAGQLLDPGFREEDFQRVKNNLINYIRVSLRANNDEELGKEVLYEMLYPNHPYGHLSDGHVEAIEKLTLTDVREFYEHNYQQQRLTLALTGDLPNGFLERVQSDLSLGLPSTDRLLHNPQIFPDQPDGLQVTLVQKDTRAVAISMGFPIEVTRAHPDFVALWLARSYFGEHRSSNSYLYQRMRGIRGMNYGDYAYIEYFPGGMFQFYPSPNLGRYSQIFQIWIRPVPPEQAHFAFRITKYELDKFVSEGISEEAFEATRDYLSKFVNVLTQSQGRQLGYALDSQYYATPEFTQYIREGLENLTVDEVNRVIRTYLQSDNLAVVVITPDAEEFVETLVNETPSPMTYNAPMPDAILEEDKVIEVYPLNISREDIRIIPVEDVFERRLFGEVWDYD